MDESKHKSHLESINNLFNCYPILGNFMNNKEGVHYSEWGDYIRWLDNQKMILKECIKKLESGYSYESILPIIRVVFENFWYINLAMNGVKFYKYLRVREGDDINKVYRKWKNDLEEAHKKGQMNDILEVYKAKKGKRIRVTYTGVVGSKDKIKLIPFHYLELGKYTPTEAHIGNLRNIIEKYLTPQHLSDKFVKFNKYLHQNYFDFSSGIIPHLLLNELITNEEKQRIMVHYNFLSLWAHPNNTTFSRRLNNSVTIDYNLVKDHYMDRLIILYIGNLANMLLKSFILFLERQENESKISKINKIEINKIRNEIKGFEELTSYFWFIYNEPSNYDKWNYAMNRIWRRSMTKKDIKEIEIKDIKDDEVPYYNDPLSRLKRMDVGYLNPLLGKYKPEFIWG